MQAHVFHILCFNLKDWVYSRVMGVDNIGEVTSRVFRPVD